MTWLGNIIPNRNVTAHTYQFKTYTVTLTIIHLVHGQVGIPISSVFSKEDTSFLGEYESTFIGKPGTRKAAQNEIVTGVE